MKTILMFLIVTNIVVSGQTVSTFAGSTANGNLFGYSDGPLSIAQFSHPSAVVIESSSGTMYISDGYNKRIRKIANGEVSTFAGGSTTFGIDGNGNGINASFGAPEELVLDSAGTLYVVDRGWNSIRKITPTGDVTTLAGSTIGISGYLDGPGIDARFNYPLGMVIDNLGNLFVTDSFNHKIRKISTTGVVSTFAGSTIGYLDGTGNIAKFNYPAGITVDNNNNLYVADTQNGVIRKITTAGEVSTVVGNNTISWLTFNVHGISRNSAGTMYFTTNSHGVYSVSSSGTISILGGSPPQFGYVDGDFSKFTQPRGITLDQSGENLYIADYGNSRIRKITLVNLANETFANNKFSIFPNPVNSVLTIQNLDNKVIDKISITDLTGKKVLEQNTNSNTVNVEKIQNGMYLLQISTTEENSVIKFIKN